MPKKYQQGGVSVYAIPNRPAPNVGEIPNSPMINAGPIPQADLSSLLNQRVDPYTRRRQYEQDLLRQQAQTDSARKEYYALKTDLFGEVHNEAQRHALEAEAAKNGVSRDEILNTNDLPSLQDKIRRYQQTLFSPIVMDVLGEVTSADKYLQKVIPQMDQAEFDQYVKNHDDYFGQKGDWQKFDTRKLDAAYYNRPAPKASARPADLTQTVRNNLSMYTAGLDLGDEDQMTKAEKVFAEDLYTKDRDRAEELGYLFVDPATKGVSLTPDGQSYYRDRIELYGLNTDAKRRASMEDFEAKRRFNNANPAPSTKSGQNDDDPAAVADYLKQWSAFKTRRERGFNEDLSGIDPLNPKVRELMTKALDKSNSLTDAQGSEDIAAASLVNDRNIRIKDLYNYAVSKGYTPSTDPTSKETAIRLATDIIMRGGGEAEMDAAFNTPRTAPKAPTPATPSVTVNPNVTVSGTPKKKRTLNDVN